MDRSEGRSHQRVHHPLPRGARPRRPRILGLGAARLLVDLEEEFVYDDPPRCFLATLEGPPIAVALTLIRACDRVTRITLAPAEAA
jgi:hypothetical protein